MATTTLDYRTPIFLQVDDAQVTTTGGAQTVDLTPAAGGALLAANNLSDVDSAATSRTNLGGTATGVAVFTAASAAAAATAIGATVTGAAVLTAASAAAARTAIGVASHFTGPLTFNCDADSTLGVIKFQADQAGTIGVVRGTLFGTGPSDQAIQVSMTINGMAVTNGDVTFALGSNDGAVQTNTATAANTFVAGDVIAIGVTTTNTASLTASFSFAYTIG